MYQIRVDTRVGKCRAMCSIPASFLIATLLKWMPKQYYYQSKQRFRLPSYTCIHGMDIHSSFKISLWSCALDWLEHNALYSNEASLLPMRIEVGPGGHSLSHPLYSTVISICVLSNRIPPPLIPTW